MAIDAVIQEKNHLVIQEMYAIVSVDSEDNEGVFAISTPQGYMPLVGAAPERVESLVTLFKSHLPEIEKLTGKKMNWKVLKFSTREDITNQFKEGPENKK